MSFDRACPRIIDRGLRKEPLDVDFVLRSVGRELHGDQMTRQNDGDLPIADDGEWTARARGGDRFLVQSGVNEPAIDEVDADTRRRRDGDAPHVQGSRIAFRA